MTGTVVERAPEPPAFAPLGQSGFRWLWPAVVVSYVGIWSQTVGAQWLLVNGPNANVTVALIQTAVMLPMMLFSLPAGVLADRYDRRWIMIAIQLYAAVVSLLLAWLTAAGLATPPVVLLFTLLLGLAGAFMQPAWQATLPEVVPRDQLGAATRLEMVGMNFGRSVGPALAGIVIGLSGVPWVFLITVATSLVLVVALLAWRRPAPTEPPRTRERFLPALNAGIRYVRNDRVVRRILLRSVLFIAPATVLWALIPIVARERLDIDAGAYGALFGALGVGAVIAALSVGKLRRTVSINGLLVGAGLVYAIVLAVIVLVPVFAVALVALVVGGAAWTTCISILNAEMQVVLPTWVRARGLAVYLVTFTGSQAVASLLWGQVAALTGIVVVFVAGAVLVAGAALSGFFLRIPEVVGSDQETSTYLGDVNVPVELQPTDGPILVTVDYTVLPENEAEFLASTAALRRSRLRSGASRWELYRVAETPDRFVETFQVASWEEHLAQHRERLTQADQRIEETTRSYIAGVGNVRHLIPPD